MCELQHADHWDLDREAKKLYDLADSYAENPKLGPVDSAIDVSRLSLYF